MESSHYCQEGKGESFYDKVIIMCQIFKGETQCDSIHSTIVQHHRVLSIGKRTRKFEYIFNTKYCL